MNAKKVLSLLLALMMVLTLAACGNSKNAAPAAADTKAAAQAETTAAAAAQAETTAAQAAAADGEWSLGVDTIKIGFVGALTGASSALGQSGEQGIEMAIEEINAAGGVGGAKLEYVGRDDEADPTKSFTYVEELIYKEGINMLVGAPNSACVAASLDTITENGIINFLSTATSAAIIDPAKYPYTFRLTTTNDIQAESLVQMAKDGGFKKIVVIGDTSALGIDGFAATKKYASQYGVDIAEYISYTADDADLSAVANSIKNSGADLVIAWSLGADAAKILRVLDRIDYMDGKCEIIGYTGTGTQTVIELTKDIEANNCTYLGVRYQCIPHGADRLPAKTQATYDKLNKKYGRYKVDGSGRTSTFGDAARVYESVYLYCDMIEKTHSMDPDVIKEALETHGSEYEIRGYEYEGGFSFSPTDHEGFSADLMCKNTMEDKLVNDYVFGDLPWIAE